ncbi:hypothetical protein JI583_14665, partial [Staphylococcus aureus]|nr:hypothetical protein [Staphylococcus aureus]MBW0729759.1 hypothetical protein [Staphylococcus aureus]MBW0738234.1 hypothetical protein [Staphylococcus aureus]MBW0743984.1 hypothetical protein [Staphylococcus aureus]MBW0746746.1 hypothetical protein [Staphylococcus aureus]
SEKKKESSDVYNNIKPLLIGDSVMVDIGESFKSSVPKSRIDGLVSEKKKESSDVYNNIKPLLIGDSVMVDIGESFKSSVPK